MGADVVLVLARAEDPELAMLEALRSRASVVIGHSLEEFAEALPQATVILHWTGKRDVLREVFVRAPKLKWVHSKSAGLDSMLFPELVASSIPLTNGTGVFSASLGEFALGAMLFFAKDFRRLIRNQAERRWEEFDCLALSEQTVGIVGYGDIGRQVAQRCHAMGMRVLALKRHPEAVGSDPLVEQVFGSDQRIEMISQCDYVVVSAPLTTETRHMMSDREFAAMKPDAVILNIGRGPVIDEAAMIQALADGRIKGAALDVFEKEPLVKDHPFYSMENVLLSPHSADHTVGWKVRAMEFFFSQFDRFEQGKPLLNVVDKHKGY